MNKYSIQKSFTINAGAGTGKTYTLSRRYINALLGYDLFADSLEHEFNYTEQKSVGVENILTLTYTNAAANEMKSRIFALMQDILDDNLDGLDKARFNKLKDKKYTKQILANAIINMHKAKICTFHAYANDVLKAKNPFKKLELIDENDKEMLFNKLYFESISKRYEDIKELNMNLLEEFCKAFVFSKAFRQNDYKLDLEDEYKKEFGIDVDYLKYNTSLLGDREVLAKKILFENDFNVKLDKKGTQEQKDYIDKLRAYIEYQNSLSIQDEFIKQFDLMQKIAKDIRKAYEIHLQVDGLVDFDMLISEFSKIEKLDDIKYIMFDEFQDTNEEQYSIINKLDNANIFSVGDIKQSIYAFQGADVNTYKKAINELEQISMNDNYRSSSTALKIINKITKGLFANLKNTDLNAKNDNIKGGGISYIIEDKENPYENTAKFLAQISKNKFYKDLKEDEQIAVMFDTRSSMPLLAKELDKLGLSYSMDDNTRFYDRAEIVCVLDTIFGFLANDLMQVATNPIFELSLDDIFAIKESGALENDKFKICKDEFKSRDLSSFLVYLYYECGMMGVFNDAKSQANLNELLDEIIFLEQSKSKDEIIKELKLRKQQSSKTQAKFVNDSKILLCTIHSTKGLEYPMVVLMNAHKVLSNNSNSLKISNNYVGFKVGDFKSFGYDLANAENKEKDIEENKRLLYVAITRATKHIVLSYQLSKNPNDNSFLGMFDYKDEMIFSDGESEYKLILDEVLAKKIKPKEVDECKLSKIIIQNKRNSATKQSKANDISQNQELAMKKGICVHKMIELFHDDFNDESLREFIAKSELSEYEDELINSFKSFANSPLNLKLKGIKNKHFELEFNDESQTGFIDLVYFDDELKGYAVVDFKTGDKANKAKYDLQLQYYKDFLEKQGLKVAKTELFWL